MKNTSRITSHPGVPSELFGGLLLLAAVWLTSLYSYLVFHSLAELFSIAVAWTVFLLAWNTRRFLNNSYLLFVSIALLFIGALDLVHTLAFKGMGVFPGADANLPTQLWIAARYLQSLSFLIAPFLLGRRLNLWLILLGYSLVTALLLLSMFYWHIFPDCYIEGVGLTPFKKASEWVISLLLLGALGYLWRRRDGFDPLVSRLLAGSLLTSIAAELVFTTYISVYDWANLTGHLFKIVAFYFLYRAIVQTGLVKPYNLIFKELKESEEALRIAKENLEVRVQERTAALREANEQLETELEARRQAEAALQTRNRQQAAVAELGQLALRSTDVGRLMEHALSSVVRVLDVKYATILEWMPERGLFVWRASTGWAQELVQNATVADAPTASEAGYALASAGPVVIQDLEKETRFFASPLLRRHGVRSGMSVMIPGNGRPFGLLSAFDAKPRVFTSDDVHFFEALANILADALERRRIDDQMRQLNADLEQRVLARTAELRAANEELEAFSYSVAHDLRGPLAGMEGFANLLLTRYGAGLDERGRHYLDRVHEGVERMKRLTEDLLTLARATRAEMKEEPIDLSAMARDVVANLSQQDPGRRVEWSIADGLCAHGDPGLIRAVLENLLANAWKFTGACTQARIEVDRAEANGESAFVVRDNGAGFDMAEADKLFKPFSRLRTAREFPGTGIGLATVQRIIARHGGRVWAEGAVDGGASFYFTLPGKPMAG